MPPVRFEPTISASERPQTYALRPRGYWERLELCMYSPYMSSCVDWFNSNELHYRPCCSSHAWQVAADHVSPSLHNPLCYIIREVKAKRTLGCTRHLVMAEWKLYRRQHCDVWLKVTRRRGSGGFRKYDR